MTLENTLPSYFVTPYRIPENLGNPKLVPGKFSVWEYRKGETTRLFDITNRTPDLFNEIMRRGIPEPEARTLFYEITK